MRMSKLSEDHSNTISFFPWFVICFYVQTLEANTLRVVRLKFHNGEIRNAINRWTAKGVERICWVFYGGEGYQKFTRQYFSNQ